MNEESIKIYLYLHKCYSWGKGGGWPAGCGRAMGEGRGAEGGIIKVNKILDILSAVGGNNERNITSQSVRV